MKSVSPTGLPQLRMDRVDPRLREAAEGMEANFMKQMVRAMRASVDENEETKNNQAIQLFRGMLDDHYAEQAARQASGGGIAEMIVRYLTQQNSVPLESGAKNFPDENASVGNAAASVNSDESGGK